jgi:hypothetical protein
MKVCIDRNNINNNNISNNNNWLTATTTSAKQNNNLNNNNNNQHPSLSLPVPMDLHQPPVNAAGLCVTIGGSRDQPQQRLRTS